MNTVNVQTTWHKVNDKIAMTYEQLKYISDLRNEENCAEWPFNSSTNAMRSLTKFDASEIIEELKNGNKIVFNQ